MRAALVCLATAAAWSRLEIALQNYPRVHDRNLRAFERGDPAARIVRAKVKNGLGNREQALLSSFALALAADAALVVEWPPRGCDNYAVRAVWACPATELQARVMASSGSTVESCSVMAQCPAPGGRYTY